MISFLTLEVNCLIYPAFAVFLLMLIPIPFLSKLVAKFIAKLESIRVAGNISLLFAIAAVGTILFLIALKDYYDHFGGAVGKDGKAFPDHHHHDFGRFLSKKWRQERNMYIHGILAILYASLLKMARLTLEADALAQKKASNAKDFTKKAAAAPTAAAASAASTPSNPSTPAAAASTKAAAAAAATNPATVAKKQD